jgi:hypothetical protein
MNSKEEKVFLIIRMLLDGDLLRHFVRGVQELTSTAVRLPGYTLEFDDDTKQFISREGLQRGSSNVF